jgi:hypothetical protein
MHASMLLLRYNFLFNIPSHVSGQYAVPHRAVFSNQILLLACYFQACPCMFFRRRSVTVSPLHQPVPDLITETPYPQGISGGMEQHSKK